jgi:peptidyl-tRNA hydrolase
MSGFFLIQQTSHKKKKKIHYKNKKKKRECNVFQSHQIYLVYEEFEDPKGVIRIRKSKMNKQHNGQKEKGQTTIYQTYK